MATHRTKFNLQDRVHIDQDKSLVGYITGITLRGNDFANYEVSYFHNGGSYSPVIEEWRLGKVEN